VYDIVEHSDPPLIVAQNFLPSAMVAEVLAELEALEPHFGRPRWSEAGQEVSDAAHAHTLCNGRDIWLPRPGVEAPVLTAKLSQFIFHQGMLEFLRECRNDWFVVIPYMRPEGRVHVINYVNGGYYNWHRDVEIMRGGKHFLVHTTFALSLAREPGSFAGGDSLYMYRNRVKRIPFAHNQLIAFPSHVAHAASEVRMDPGARFMDGRFNVQFWLTAGLANWSP